MGTLFRPQVILIAVIGAVAALAQQEDSAAISATVTAQIVAVSVSDGGVAYGTLALSDTNNTLSGTALEQQTITNDGTVLSSLSLGSGDATGAVLWNLVACASATTNAFGHQYELNDAGSLTVGTFEPTEFSATNDPVDTLVNLVANTSTTLDLGICMPTSTLDSGLHSIAVTVLLTEG